MGGATVFVTTLVLILVLAGGFGWVFGGGFGWVFLRVGVGEWVAGGVLLLLWVGVRDGVWIEPVLSVGAVTVGIVSVAAGLDTIAVALDDGFPGDWRPGGLPRVDATAIAPEPATISTP